MCLRLIYSIKVFSLPPICEVKLVMKSNFSDHLLLCLQVVSFVLIFFTRCC